MSSELILSTNNSNKKWRIPNENISIHNRSSNSNSTNSSSKNNKHIRNNTIITTASIDIKMIPSPLLKKRKGRGSNNAKNKNISKSTMTDYFLSNNNNNNNNDKTNDEIMVHTRGLSVSAEDESFPSSFVTPTKKKIKTATARLTKTSWPECVKGGDQLEYRHCESSMNSSNIVTPPPCPTTTVSMNDCLQILVTKSKHTNKNNSSSNNSKSLKGKSFSNNNIKKEKQQQLYLDFGQASFGKRITCKICNMVFVEGVLDDESNHVKLCKEYSLGVSFPSWKRERVVSTYDNGDRVVEIRPTDSKLFQNKAIAIKSIIDAEMGFIDDEDDSTTNDNSNPAVKYTAYLYISAHKRVIGYCSAEIISTAYKLLYNIHNNNKHNGLERSREPIQHPRSQPLLGIRQIWCHASHRQSKIATNLINCARERMVFGSYIPIDNIAFSSPTSDGYAFSKKYTNDLTPLVYDLSSIP